ncbi:hypothetical protein EVAR_95563_1 [Eumeta japonica]|uniref:Uncharacterized protein n=1 Tax=Eumeta variegata TaxID=151549 RepID=A0A4C2A4U5_EUMVA|nr:hypothetical protein EVAR_95563_1 [Eumeta japonica]
MAKVVVTIQPRVTDSWMRKFVPPPYTMGLPSTSPRRDSLTIPVPHLRYAAAKASAVSHIEESTENRVVSAERQRIVFESQDAGGSIT